MKNDLDNLKFSTKSIMITDKQKEFIETLMDDLLDYTDEYNNIEYWKLSKQDASKLIEEMKNELFDYHYTDECYDLGDIYDIY